MRYNTKCRQNALILAMIHARKALTSIRLHKNALVANKDVSIAMITANVWNTVPLNVRIAFSRLITALSAKKAPSIRL